MTPGPLLIAALSGRMLAASARRAGFQPFVVDCFGDEDTAELAVALRTLPSAFTRGFDAAELIAALKGVAHGSQAERASLPPLVLGAGFECEPKVVAALSEHFRLCACDASVLTRCKEPAALFPLLRELGIVHPETRLDPPVDASGAWLSKRTGGSGGTHIFRHNPASRHRPHRYYQRELTGELISATSLIGDDGQAFAFTRSWLSPSGRHPFRFGGITGHIELDEDLEARIVDACLSLTPELGLKGLVSFDFIIADGEANLLEINPRPGASLDILEDASGTLLTAHVNSFLGGEAIGHLSRNWRPRPQAAAYVYADAGDLVIPQLDWPDWVSDRPPPGRTIPASFPVVTVRAGADDPDTAEQVCRVRASEIIDMLYRAIGNTGNSTHDK